MKQRAVKKKQGKALPSIEETLRQHAFFSGLDIDLIALIADFGSRKSFPSDTLIFRRGENAGKFFLIEQGLVSVGINPELHSPVNIQTITDNEVLGWSWLIPPYLWQFDARTLEPTRAVVLDAKKLRALFATRPDLGYEISRRLLQVVGRRLQATRVQFWDIYRMHYMLQTTVPEQSTK